MSICKYPQPEHVDTLPYPPQNIKGSRAGSNLVLVTRKISNMCCQRMKSLHQHFSPFSCRRILQFSFFGVEWKGRGKRKVLCRRGRFEINRSNSQSDDFIVNGQKHMGHHGTKLGGPKFGCYVVEQPRKQHNGLVLFIKYVFDSFRQRPWVGNGNIPS